MFRKLLSISSLSGASSDRICGIRVHLTSPEPSCITVLGVYLSCADQGIDAYCSALLGLEHLISNELKLWTCSDCQGFQCSPGSSRGTQEIRHPQPAGCLVTAARQSV